MANIAFADANAWLEPTKLTLSSETFDTALGEQVSSLVLGRFHDTFDTEAWVSPETTPKLVKTIIAMHYVAWTYDKFYSDDAEANAYAALLRSYADANVESLLSGDVILDEEPDATVGIESPAFFPTDASSLNRPTSDFPSDGGPSFMMGTVF